MAFEVSNNVERRTGGPSQETTHPAYYAAHIYQRGVDFERPKFTFQTNKLQEDVGTSLDDSTIWPAPTVLTI